MPAIRFRTALALFLCSISPLQAGVAAHGGQIWKELSDKRSALKTFHQEFDVTRTVKRTDFNAETKSSLIVDFANGRWREQFMSGAGSHFVLFDGTNTFKFEDGGSEYVLVKRSPKEPSFQLEVYSEVGLELSKAVERNRVPCGLPGLQHECVILDVPTKPWVRRESNGNVRMLGGTERMVFDTATGLLISSGRMETIYDGRGGYQSTTMYVLTRLSYNVPIQDSLFHLPATATKEVKELPQWNAAMIRKQLGGKPAPDLALTDLQGKIVKLSDFKGKTVLLDFWATWCGPCRADGPALDKLYRKYGNKNLVVIGVSVNEERSVVQKFLSEHPHEYPIALTTENEMPRPYQIRVVPTYIVINPEGYLTAATEGDQGFSELRRLLKKAGLVAD